MSQTSVPGGEEVRAEQLVAGDLLLRGDHWWHVETAMYEKPRISNPVVALRCIDENREVREFTIPADRPVHRNGTA